MGTLKILLVALALGMMPLAAAAQEPTTPSQVVDKIVAQEQVEVQRHERLRQPALQD